MPKTFDWNRLIEVSVGILEVDANDFWAMTPVEWRHSANGWKMAQGINKVEAPNRNDVTDMSQAFPD